MHAQALPRKLVGDLIKDQAIQEAQAKGDMKFGKRSTNFMPMVGSRRCRMRLRCHTTSMFGEIDGAKGAWGSSALSAGPVQTPGIFANGWCWEPSQAQDDQAVAGTSQDRAST